MPPSIPWHHLIDAAQQQVDDAARTLAEAINRHTAAQQQLDMLATYRAEYQTALGSHSQSGVSITRLNNHRQFIDKLDTAIRQQQDVVHQAQLQVSHYQREWQARHRKLKSFDTLAHRERQRESARHAKQEQHLLDEQATQRFHHNRSKPT